MRARALLAGLLAFGCYTPVEKVTLRVELPADVADRFKELEVLPHIAELRREGRRGVVVLELNRKARRVELKLPEACTRVVDLSALPSGMPATQMLEPLFELGPSERVVGIDRFFSLEANARCTEANESKSSFAWTGGAALGTVVHSGERQFSARSGAALPESPRGTGIVPVSARQQRALRSEITFTATLPDGHRYQRVLGVSTVARASGLPDVGVDHPVLLSGSAWQLAGKPAESKSELRSLGPHLSEMRPDVPGGYRLIGDNGRELLVHSGRYDQTPLDCGRGDCHGELAWQAAQSPMAQVLASDLGGCHSLDNPDCASACHATGEPGTKDGGFSHVQRALQLSVLPAEYEQLPHSLQRLGGVSCLACHGPNKIPAPDQRLAMLRSEVCAVCHDAPPRYGHVMALAASRMGHADSAPMTRSPSCARCHTAWGALGRKAPASVESAGITCVTCHDVHPHGAGREATPHAAESLLRQLALPETLPQPPASFRGVSRVCIGCHAPSSDSLRPEASAAALVAGQGGFEPQSGAPLALEGPHARPARGCLTCHDSGPSDLQLGKSHGFRATDESCAKCHQKPPARDAALAERARQLLARLDPSRADGSLDNPWHARYELVLPTPQHTRALRNVLLVLEDPAADVHHPSYAKSLLDAAERFLSGAQP
ncbi:MAG TPA: cytochrome c3 family protein [Polyangiaceae bacterium]|nr:cytochrome c3 family protein [Polyangiaceae bacterium]